MSASGKSRGRGVLPGSDPEQLLDPPPGAIWAGFMLPDTLPIIGNDYGDWLCLRIAADGTVSELVQWSHGGGDWIPCGKTLAEGLLYDAAVRVMYPQRAAPVEGESTDPQVFRAAEWARQWMAQRGRLVPRFWPYDGEQSREIKAHALLDVLAGAGIAEFAVCRDRILGYLESPLKSRSEAALAQELGVSWEPEFVSWLFDTARIPAAARSNWWASYRRLTVTSSRRIGRPPKCRPWPCWSTAAISDGHSTSPAGPRSGVA